MFLFLILTVTKSLFVVINICIFKDVRAQLIIHDIFICLFYKLMCTDELFTIFYWLYLILD